MLRGSREPRGLGFGVRRLVWRRLDHHVIIASGASALWSEATQRANVGDELPDLFVRQPILPRRHSVRPSCGDRGEDLIWRATVDPLVVHERRPHAAATIRVTVAT